ncbi:hypothetical protein J6590_087270 [Homalodisca vitripennis]|nr:hypothetical protein J6590_087270 [Homalodisca vitripennis]
MNKYPMIQSMDMVLISGYKCDYWVRVAIAAPAFDDEKRVNVCVIEEACRSRELRIPRVNEFCFSKEVGVQGRRPTVPPTEPDGMELCVWSSKVTPGRSPTH